MKRTSLYLILLAISASFVISCDQRSKGKYTLPYTFTNTCYSVPDNVNKVEEYEYDKRGKLLRSSVFDFNEQGNLTAINFDQKEMGYSVSYNYTYVGERLVKIESPSKKTELVYNDKNQLQTVKFSIDNEGEITPEYDESYEYFDDGKLKMHSISFYESDGESTEYAYHPNGKLASSVKRGLQFAEEDEYDSITGRVNIHREYEGDPLKLKNTYYYSYTNDDNGNWIKAEKKNKRGKLVAKLERNYTIREVPEIQKNEESNNNIAEFSALLPGGNFISDFINDAEYRIIENNANNNTPTGILFIVLLVLTLLFAWFYLHKANKKRDLFKNFSGKTTSDGMKRMWMFNKEPYMKVAISIFLVLLAFISAILAVMAFGGVTYGILFVIKWILLAVVFIGWICLIGGVLALIFAKHPAGCLPTIIGWVIVSFQDPITKFGESIVNWGFGFMNDLNIFSWGLGLFVKFWDVILATFLTPMAIFSAFALLIILIVFLLMGLEFSVMKAYSVRRPCPSCGSTHTPEYWVDEHHKHPVPLHPGVYGVFTQRNPQTGKKLPTMLFNGKGKLLRKCSSCGIFMKADAEKTFGTEKHIGIVGHRSSGKSYLLYTALGELKKQFGDRVSQMDAEYDTNIDANYKRISIGGNIQTDLKDSYKAVQLILNRKMNPVPYHLFFYDVAGEKFNQASTASKTAMDFYRNVQLIMFVIDPAMVDYSFNPPSDNIEKWLAKHSSPERFSTDGIFSTLKNILESVGRKTKNIDFMFVCVKADTGYLEACNYPISGEDLGIEQFMREELGLSNLVDAAKGSFRSVKFDISSVKPEFRGRLTSLFINTLKHLGVS
jgi:hypothetical protein